MGKRSNFDRIAKDYYRTFDPKAGRSIKEHLPENYTYVEPFCGRGDLIKQLSGECIYASDIEPEYEFNDTGLTFHEKGYTMLTDSEIGDADYIISNPPWSRPLLHSAIDFFGSKKKTWLLFDSDWSNTKQASPYLEKYCKKIVSVGRMRWIEGTNQSGKDNVSWYLFVPDKETGDVIEFYGIGI